MRVSHFGADKTRVPRLIWTSRCWLTRDSQSGTETRSLRHLREMRESTSHSESAEQVISAESSICCWRARCFLRRLAFWLSHMGCWEPPTTWNYRVWSRWGWQDWFSLSLCSCATTFACGSSQRHWSGLHRLQGGFQNLFKSGSLCAVSNSLGHFRSNL